MARTSDMEGVNLIVKMPFGSHLYGTDTPESDTDYKGVFLPTKRQILLGRIPKSVAFNTKKGNKEKNDPEDVDTEYYSLHYFLKLACEGQTVAIDMLHAPCRILERSSGIWEFLHEHRREFHTRNLQAFVGYARRQAAKYGIKGSRLNASKAVIDYLLRFAPETKLAEVWDGLPKGEHIGTPENPVTGLVEYEVCGRKVQPTVTAEYALGVFRKYHDNYGGRARMAADNEGIDWKAVSHALRAAYQVEQILVSGDIRFPLEQADYLREVKAGRYHYLDEVAPRLEEMMEKVEALAAKSDLPEKVDRAHWDDFLIRTLEEHVLRG